jgi:pterin-4a-carbinolamine dehydratase
MVGKTNQNTMWSYLRQLVSVSPITTTTTPPPIATTTSIHRFLSSTTTSRPDPFTRRPTSKCDPYGQGGLPLTWSEARHLLPTVDAQWKLWKDKDGTCDEHTTEATLDDEYNDNNINKNTTNDDGMIAPFAIVKDFRHPDYMQGAQFVTHVSAVAQMNHHFPHQILLERYLERSPNRVWTVRTRIICRTVVLQGLSHHDFFLAAMLDVESNRPEVRNLLLT